MSSTEAEHYVDADHDVAQDLINAAKEALVEKPEGPGADGDGDAHTKASEVLQNVAHIVLDKSNQAADSSTAYIESVVHKVQDYAQNVANESTSIIPEALSRSAVHIGDGDGSSGSDGGILTTVATWCSTLCGSKNNAPGAGPRSVDVRAAAEDVAEALHSSTTASTSEAPSPHDITPAETPPESAEPAKPATTSE